MSSAKKKYKKMVKWGYGDSGVAAGSSLRRQESSRFTHTSDWLGRGTPAQARTAAIHWFSRGKTRAPWDGGLKHESQRQHS